MRIWYQSLGRLDAWGGYPAQLGAMIDRARSPTTEIVLNGTQRGIAEYHATLAHEAKGDVLRNLRQAVAEQADAFVIGNFFDIGLEEAREVAPFPVLGLGETSIALSHFMGQSYGLICPNAKYAARMERRLRADRLDARLAGLAVLDMPRLTAMGAAFDDPDALARLVEAIGHAVDRELGAAEVVVPAGGVVMALMDKAGITRFDTGAPVVNGIAGLIAMAEAATSLSRLNGGTFTSRHLSHARPDMQERKRIDDLYGADIFPDWTS
ncbi:aspartate/glutamate racemase family protein [Stappia stellulata]|uniref:aspartate/glutamate racemase family protein n=1 Tax=Stappia stellulata TaxID=71235 RepID=UPI0003FEE425|nr:aspartate/glutamate racemase family protein [Stappia stellulata]